MSSNNKDATPLGAEVRVGSNSQQATNGTSSTSSSSGDDTTITPPCSSASSISSPLAQTTSTSTTVTPSSSNYAAESRASVGATEGGSGAESNGNLPAPTVCRNYKCAKCAFVSNKAKKFLFHQKDVHGENIAVYGCNHCEYASRHKNKVMRHKRLVHKLAASASDDLSAMDDVPTSTACAGQDSADVAKAAPVTTVCKVTSGGAAVAAVVKSTAATAGEFGSNVGSGAVQSSSGGGGSVVWTSRGGINVIATPVCGAGKETIIPVSSERNVKAEAGVKVEQCSLVETRSKSNGGVRQLKSSGLLKYGECNSGAGTVCAQISSTLTNTAAPVSRLVSSKSFNNNSCGGQFADSTLDACQKSAAIEITGQDATTSGMLDNNMASLNTSDGQILSLDMAPNALIFDDSARASPAGAGSEEDSQDSSVSNLDASKADFLDGVFRCKLCRYSNPHKWKIVSHIRSSHLRRTVFKCPFCEFVTERKIEWCAHKTMHSGKAVFFCTECAYQTTMKRNYERHQERHLMNGPRRCSLCTYSSTGEGAIQRHMAEYHPPSPVKDALQASSPAISTHQAMQGNVLQEQYASVALVTTSPIDSKQHTYSKCNNNSSSVRTLNPVACSQFSTPRQSTPENQNLLNTECSNSLQPSTSSGFLDYNTTTQSNPSSSSFCHEDHSPCETDAMPGSGAGPESPVAPGDTAVQCRICGMILRSDSKLRTHLIAHSNNSRWSCTLCPLRYKRPADLNRHMKRKHEITLRDVGYIGEKEVSDHVALSRETICAPLGVVAIAPSAHTSPATILISAPAAHSAPAMYNKSASSLLSGGRSDDNDDEQPLNLSVKESSALNYRRTDSGSFQNEPLDLSVVPIGSSFTDRTPARSSTTTMTSIDGQHHGDIASKLKCSHCSYVSKRSSDLKRHSLVHCTEKCYRCSHCSKSYKLQFDLTRHVNRTHPGGGSGGSGASQPRTLVVQLPPASMVDGRREMTVGDTIMAEAKSLGYNHPTADNSDQSLSGIAIPSIPSPLLNRDLSFDDASVQAFGCAEQPKLELGTAAVENNNLTCGLVKAGGGSEKVVSVVVGGGPGGVGGGRKAGDVDGDGSEEGNILACKYCKYVGKYRAELERHVRMHTGDKPHRCHFCTYKTIWKGDMKRHLVKHHSNEITSHGNLRELVELTYHPDESTPASGPSTEDKRGDSASSKSVLESKRGPVKGANLSGIPAAEYLDHNMNVDHSGDRKQPVRQTGNQNVQEMGGGVGRSVSSSQISQLYRCPQCSYACDLPSKMKRHIEIHENLKRFVCTVCGKRSNWMWDVRKHMHKRHRGAELLIKELSEEEARNTLEAYMSTLESRRQMAELQNMEEDGSVGSDTSDADESADGSAATPVDVESLAEQYANEVAAMFYGNPAINGAEHKSNLAVRPSSGVSASGAMLGKHSMGDMSGKFRCYDGAGTSVATKRFRPYKCSQCGRRSNWRWDLNKHIRAAHPSAHLIELSRHEARTTFHEVLQRDAKEKQLMTSGGHPATFSLPNKDDLKADKSDVNNCTASAQCQSIETNKDILQRAVVTHVKKLPKMDDFELKSGEKIDHSATDLSIEGTSTLRGSGKSPSSTSLSYTVDALKLKRFQCSECPYRSNFRSDVGRHIRHKHKKTECRIVVLTQVEASATLTQYLDTWARKKFVPSPNKKPPSLVNSDLNSISHSVGGDNGSVTDHLTAKVTPSKSATSIVVQNHFYKCKLCGYVDANESNVKHHWQVQHQFVLVNNDGKYESFSDVFEEICDVESRVESHKPADDVVNQSSETMTSTLHDDLLATGTKLSCDLCPYQTKKIALMTIHQTYHKPQVNNRFKCKYCPYYVCAPRLLHQHTRLHLVVDGQSPCSATDACHFEEVMDAKNESTSAATPKPLLTAPYTALVEASGTMMQVAPRTILRTRYFCTRCPYVSGNRNDYRYHRQFHRQNSLPGWFKCDDCSYCACQKRLLTQHVRVHTDEYRERRVKLSAQSIIKLNRVLDSEHQLDTSMDISLLNQDSDGRLDIDSSVRDLSCSAGSYSTRNSKSVNRSSHSEGNDLSAATPTGDDDLSNCSQSGVGSCSTLACSKQVDSIRVKSEFRGNDSNGLNMHFVSACKDDDDASKTTEAEMNFIFDESKKTFCCNRCPYTNQKRDQLVGHMRLHLTKSELQCQYCDYSVSRVHLLNQHVRVHGISATNGVNGMRGTLYLHSLDSVTDSVHMTRRKRLRMARDRRAARKCCTPAELDEICKLLSETDGARTLSIDTANACGDVKKDGVIVGATRRVVDHMLKRHYMAFLGLQPVISSSSDSGDSCSDSDILAAVPRKKFSRIEN